MATGRLLKCIYIGVSKWKQNNQVLCMLFKLKTPSQRMKVERNARLKGGQVRRATATAYARIMPLSDTTSTLRHFNSSFVLSQTTPYKQCYKLRLHCGVVDSSF